MVTHRPVRATTPVQIAISAPGAGRYSPGKGDEVLQEQQTVNASTVSRGRAYPRAPAESRGKTGPVKVGLNARCRKLWSYSKKDSKNLVCGSSCRCSTGPSSSAGPSCSAGPSSAAGPSSSANPSFEVQIANPRARVVVQSKKRPRLNSAGTGPRRYKVEVPVINLDIEEKMKEVEHENEVEDDQGKKDDNAAIVMVLQAFQMNIRDEAAQIDKARLAERVERVLELLSLEILERE